jgi:hypothetical protein
MKDYVAITKTYLFPRQRTELELNIEATVIPPDPCDRYDGWTIKLEGIYAAENNVHVGVLEGEEVALKHLITRHPTIYEQIETDLIRAYRSNHHIKNSRWVYNNAPET